MMKDEQSRRGECGFAFDRLHKLQLVGVGEGGIEIDHFKGALVVSYKALGCHGF